MKKFFEKIKNFCVKNPIGAILISLCVITVIVSVILMATLIPHSDLTKIEIVSSPDKTQYIEGENVDTTGMVVKAYHGKKSQIVTDYTLDKTQLSLGDTEVKVSYADSGVVKSATFAVNVVKKNLLSIEITKLPDKLDYIEHSYFDTSGMEVTAYYDNGKNQVVEDWDYDKKGKLQLDDTVITISYGGKSAEINITIEAKVLQSIYVKSQPKKLSYFEGEYFDFLGVEIFAKYDNADDELVRDWDYDKKELLTISDSAVEFAFAMHGVEKTAIVEITVELAPSVDKDQELAQNILDLLPAVDTMTVENLPSIDYTLSLLDKLSQLTPEQLATKQQLEAKRAEIIENLPPQAEKVFDVTYKVGGELNFEDIDFGDNPAKYLNSDGAVILSPASSQIAIEQGYIFNGWLIDGQFVEKLENLTSDVTVFADFKMTASVVVEFVDYYDDTLLLEQVGIERTANYDLQSANIDTIIYSACGEVPIAYYTHDRARVYSVDLSKGKTVVVYVVKMQARELHIDGSKGASVSWIYDFDVAGVAEQTSKMPDVGNVFIIPIGASVKIVSMHANIGDILVDGVSKGTNFNNTVVQAEFDMTEGEYAVSVAFTTRLSDVSTLSFLGYNQHSIVYPSGWDGYIADIDMDTVKFIYDEDNANYITEYSIDGVVLYLDDLTEYQFVGDTQIYVTRVRNSFSLTVNYIGGQERIDGLVGKQSLQSALSTISEEALATLNAILEDDRLYVDYQKSESVSVDDVLAQIMRNNIVVYSDWQRPVSPPPVFDEVDYSDCDFVNTWSALFANDSDVLASDLTLTADGLYIYRTYINGNLSANISGVYRIEDGKVQLKTFNLNYQYQLVDKDDLIIDITFAHDGIISMPFIYLQDTTLTVFNHTATCGSVRPVNYTNREFVGSYDFDGANIELRENGTAEIRYGDYSIITVYRVTDDGRLFIFDNGEIGTGAIKGILEVK